MERLFIDDLEVSSPSKNDFVLYIDEEDNVVHYGLVLDASDYGVYILSKIAGSQLGIVHRVETPPTDAKEVRWIYADPTK